MEREFCALLVDNGNSRLKWAVLRGDRFISGSPVLTAGRIAQAELHRLWGELAPAPQRALIANVAGPVAAEQLCAFIRTRWRFEPEFVRSQATGFGVVSGYAQPEALGVDRWLALVAARNRYALPALIADCGTALTVDVIDSAGRHRGGLICPGLKLMAEALALRASGIGWTAWSGRREGLGDGTAAAVCLGARQAALGLIERTFRQQQSLYPGLRLLLTGGDAAELALGLEIPAQVVPDLVLEGLAVVARVIP
ncbi:type III pantothenate kinase [Methylothermus subterraneus]